MAAIFRTIVDWPYHLIIGPGYILETEKEAFAWSESQFAINAIFEYVSLQQMNHDQDIRDVQNIDPNK